jgi:hypothetical protein
VCGGGLDKKSESEVRYGNIFKEKEERLKKILNEGNLRREIIKLERLFYKEEDKRKRKKKYYKNFIYIIKNGKSVNRE